MLNLSFFSFSIVTDKKLLLACYPVGGQVKGFGFTPAGRIRVALSQKQGVEK